MCKSTKPVVSKLDSTYHISIIQGIREGKPFYRAEYTCAASQPEEKAHRLQNQSPLVVIQIELLREMTSEVTGQIDAKDEGPNKIQDGGQNGMPVSLGLNRLVSLSGFCLVISRPYDHLHISVQVLWVEHTHVSQT